MQQMTYVHALTEKAEDYLEAILNVAVTKGYARTKDVAAELGVSPSSVVEMFQKLDAIGLVEYRKYEGVVLTPQGRQVAETIKYRHDALLGLLLLVGVPKERAQKDACTMEHELSGISVEKIKMFVEYMNSQPAFQNILRDYHAYCRTKSYSPNEGD